MRIVVRILSLLPLNVLYFLSDFFYFIVYRVVRYRISVVREQLAFAFPDVHEKERKKIEKKFYHHFCDILVETIYMQRISGKELSRRCHFTENAKNIFSGYQKQKIPFIAVLGHCGNWEWVNLGFSACFTIPLLGIYHPLSNPFWDRWIQRQRSRFGGKMIPMNQTLRYLNTLDPSCVAIGLIADQSAPPEASYCVEFMNRKTTVFKGPEKLSVKFRIPVLYISVLKPSRGMYIVDVIRISEHPEQEAEKAITLKHVQELEKNIRHQPEIWLWTHRRWKHRCEASTER